MHVHLSASCGEIYIMKFQTMMFIIYGHATCSINYVLIYIDTVYETLLQLECHKINSVSGISWLAMAFFISSNLEDGPCMLILMYEHTVVTKVYLLNHELVHV